MQGLEDHCFRFTSFELFNGLPASYGLFVTTEAALF